MVILPQLDIQAEVLLWQTFLIIIKVAGGQESDLAGSFVIGDREGAFGLGELLGEVEVFFLDVVPVKVRIIRVHAVEVDGGVFFLVEWSITP